MSAAARELSSAKVIYEGAKRRVMLFVTTENAIYASFDHGDSCLPLQNDLPHAPYDDPTTGENPEYGASINYHLRAPLPSAPTVLDIASSDYRPTDQHVEVQRLLAQELGTHLATMDVLILNDVAAFNRLLRQLKLPSLIVSI